MQSCAVNGQNRYYMTIKKRRQNHLHVQLNLCSYISASTGLVTMLLFLPGIFVEYDDPTYRVGEKKRLEKKGQLPQVHKLSSVVTTMYALKFCFSRHRRPPTAASGPRRRSRK